MAGIYQVTIVEEGFAAATPADLARLLRGSFLLIGRLHHRLFKMLKFRKLATRRYGLTPRRGEPGSGRSFEGSYAQAKVEGRRLYYFSDEPLPIGENKPFVWSGRTRAAVAASRGVRAKASQSGKASAEVVLGARQLNRAGKQKRIDLNEEMRRVTPQENQHMEEQGGRRFERDLSRLPARRTTTIKG